MRQLILDTETTGLEVSQGHRLIEVGCIELMNRRATGSFFHRYINPDRTIDAGAIEVHGITNEKVAGEPRFHEIAKELWEYLAGAELIIHNASFDLGFLDMEFRRVGYTQRLSEVCSIVDTVALARKLHPGQKVNLDALCRRYNVDNSRRSYHGALLDASLLADVYLAMTGGQSALLLDDSPRAGAAAGRSRFAEILGAPDRPLRVIVANEAEQGAHLERLKTIQKKSGGKLIWAGELADA